MGRVGPFSLETDSSEFSPTIRISPKLFASCKYLTCPTCKISKQPFVKTIFFPFFLERFTISCISLKLFICASEVLLCKLASYSSISSSVTVAEPIFPTTTPAAKFAKEAVSSIFLPALSEKAIDAITVSPAPVTSKPLLQLLEIF